MFGTFAAMGGANQVQEAFTDQEGPSLQNLLGLTPIIGGQIDDPGETLFTPLDKVADLVDRIRKLFGESEEERR